MRRPCALTLDLDDTLLDGAGLVESIVRVCEALCELHRGLDAAQLRAANAGAWTEYWTEVAEDWALGRLDSATFSLEGWRRTLLACGCTDETVVTTARDLHRTYARDAHRLYDDVQQLLDHVAGVGLPIALVTNGASDVQREKLEVLGIEDRFVAVIVSGELGAAKPDTRPFAAALEALGTEPSATWHVGDNLATDVGGALRSGLVAVWLNRSARARGPQDPEPDLEIPSMVRLVSILGAAEGSAS